MSSRGSYIKNLHVTTDEYVSVRQYDANTFELVGATKSFHSLPDYSHTPNRIYVKVNKDGLREIRFYNEKCEAYLEIGYHKENKIALDYEKNKKILHYHYLDPQNNFSRTDAQRITDDLKNKVKYILKEFNL